MEIANIREKLDVRNADLARMRAFYQGVFLLKVEHANWEAVSTGLRPSGRFWGAVSATVMIRREMSCSFAKPSGSPPRHEGSRGRNHRFVRTARKGIHRGSCPGALERVRVARVSFRASLAPAEYREIIQSHEFGVEAHVVEDPDCGGHTVWLARRSGADAD